MLLRSQAVHSSPKSSAEYLRRAESSERAGADVSADDGGESGNGKKKNTTIPYPKTATNPNSNLDRFLLFLTTNRHLPANKNDATKQQQ